ncbi:MAG: hypothetical protein JWO26_2314 [Rhodospirillales bacterium]|jgi:hypothetical protein|nr:hypothetical protein [Rhodospirillales bacterium]MDB5382682.1 hypothetical protein [Rhodospirillales bacterium]
MKAVLIGVVVAVTLALGAAFVMDTQIQRTADVAFQTQGVRL